MTYRTKAQHDAIKQQTQVKSTHFPIRKINNQSAYWNSVGSSIENSFTEALAELQRYLESMELKEKLNQDLKVNDTSEKKTKV